MKYGRQDHSFFSNEPRFNERIEACSPEAT